MSGSLTSRTEFAQLGAPLQSHSPFASLPLSSAPGRGVVATARDGLAITHIPVTLWRLADGSGGLAVFEIAVPRSYAGSFWHVVTESSAEFGFVRD